MAETPESGQTPSAPEPDPALEAAAASAALRRATGAAKPSRRSRPRRAPGASRDPMPLSAAVDDLVRDRGWERDSSLALLFNEWGQIVGPDLAAHVAPETFDDGRLVLRAESTAWATQVRHLLPGVQRAVDDRVGRGIVREIAVLGPAGPSWKAGPLRVKGRGPRDTYG